MEARDAIEILKKNYPKTAKMIDGRYVGCSDYCSGKTSRNFKRNN